MYSPAVLPVRVWVYCAVTGSSNTVSVPSVTGTESLVQVTVVAGPPVEIHVRVNTKSDTAAPQDIVTSPKINGGGYAEIHKLCSVVYLQQDVAYFYFHCITPQ